MGSVQKWKGNRYRAHWRDPEGRSQSQVFDYKADALAHIDRVEADIERGSYLTPGDRKMTFGDYVENHWLDAQTWRPSTREQFDSHWKRHLKPRWGSVPLASIRRTEVQTWLNGLSLAPATVEAIYRRFVSIVRSAVLDGLIERVPTVRIVLPAAPPSSHRLHVPTLEQVEALAAAVPARYSALVGTIATLGLRPGEAAGLTIERVNFLKREVVIDRQLITRVGTGVVLAEPKTKAGRRTLPAPQGLLDQLAGHLDDFGAVELDPGASLIFSTRDRTPLRRNTLGDIWNRAARKVGLPDDLRGWHSLRHFAITRLIAAGINPDYVRQFAGHESLRETLEVYSGWWPSDADDAREALSAALRAVSTRTA